jgi:hypothetical protein
MPGNNQYADELRSVGQPRAAIATSTPHCAGQLVGTRFSFDEWTLSDLGGNAPEDHGCGLLNGFQAFAQKVGVSVPKLTAAKLIKTSPNGSLNQTSASSYDLIIEDEPACSVQVLGPAVRSLRDGF